MFNWNRFTTTVAFLALIGMGIFGYLYENEKQLNEDTTIDINKYKRNAEFSDSINTVLINVNQELDSTLSWYEKENANINWQLEKIEQELIESKEELQNMTLEQIAQYIVDNFLGDNYKIYKENDTTFIAFELITTKDIVEQNMQFKALNKRFEQLSIQGNIKDTLIKKQAKTISILNNSVDTLKTKYNDIIIDNRDYSIKIIELTNEIDKQKMLKRIAIITDIGLIILLIAI